MTSEQPTWSTSRVRSTFIEYFKDKDHTFVPSSGVYIPSDKTLLFANAGMNQYKPIFLGTADPNSDMATWKRATNSQKCIRAGGKHNDLEDVGRDSYHHTMFEMLGSWSFGDYFKSECIKWSWELLTEVYKLDPERLYVTYFEGDETLGLEPDNEAKEEWKKYVPEDRIIASNAKDNFWEMGKTGPCGPCSEIHYDKVGNGYGKSRVNEDDPKVIEIWNLVFMQFVREEENGPLKPLPAKHIDTGMGLERLTSILQGKPGNYGIDLFQDLFSRIQELTGAPAYTGKYDGEDPKGIDTAYRIVADHIRTITLAISDGVLPSNVGRGYVLRRIIRRAVCTGVEYLGVSVDSGFFSKLAPRVVELMGDAFPSLKDNIDEVTTIINGEELQFGRTLKMGLKRFDRVTKGKEKGFLIPGEETAKLFHTYGFPFDLTRQKATARGFLVDKAAHKVAMAANAGIVEGAAKKMSLLPLHGEAVADLNDQTIATTDDSIKYNPKETEATLVAIWCGRKKGFCEFLDNSFYNEAVDEENPKNLVGFIFDKTPFYAEQGGQVYDLGTIKSASGDISLEVDSVQVYGGYVVHYVTPSGEIKVNDAMTLSIDESRRSLVTNNHTSTHLCNHALKCKLGDHVDQQGSSVLENRLRFDFSHSKPVEQKELAEIDERVREAISKDLKVYDKEIPLDEAKSIRGVRAMFGETYPDPVRVVSVGVSVEDLIANPCNEEWENYAIEFCGGTHTPSIKVIRSFTTISEEGIAKGIRRIICLTGDEAEKALKAAEELDAKIKTTLEGLGGNELSSNVAELLKELDAETCFPYSEKLRLRTVLGDYKKKAIAELKAKEKQFKAKANEYAAEVIKKLNETAQPFLVEQVELGNNCGLLKTAIAKIQKTHSIPVLFVSPWAGKVAVVGASPKAMVGQLAANKWISATVSSVNGKGGGKPESAQGVCNGLDDSQVATLLKTASEFASSNLN